MAASSDRQRAYLERLAAALRRRLAELPAHPAVLIAGDEADATLANAARDLELSARAYMAAKLRAYDAALARIADGTYGRCLGCGGAVGAARLEVLPEADRCYPCQQAAEAAQVAAVLPRGDDWPEEEEC